MLRVLLIGGCLLLPTLSSAANAPKEFIFGEDIIESGPLTCDDCGPVDVKTQARFGKLIHLREDFKDKVVASVSEL